MTFIKASNVQPEKPIMLPRLYVLSRADLIGQATTKGYQAAQSAHAVAAYLLKYPEQTWNNEWLIVVSVEDEERLEYYSWKAQTHGFPVAEWHEPDLENTLTAIAIEINNEKDATLFRKLPLL